MKRIIRLFEQGNVCVCGLRGTGKDMLMANVAVRRRRPYVSNTHYGGKCIPFHPLDYDCGRNIYVQFLCGEVNYYEYPHVDGTDLYIGDAGIYFPSQYCSELNRHYGYMATFMALSRHLGKCNVHFNSQNLNRVWDKIREQSDCYIMCRNCIVLFGKIVIQRLRVYELYESAVKRVPPFRLPKPLVNPDRKFQWRIQKQNYDIAHGEINSYTLIYWNRSNYNTRIFKEVLASGKKIEKNP